MWSGFVRIFIVLSLFLFVVESTRKCLRLPIVLAATSEAVTMGLDQSKAQHESRSRGRVDDVGGSGKNRETANRSSDNDILESTCGSGNSRGKSSDGGDGIAIPTDGFLNSGQPLFRRGQVVMWMRWRKTKRWYEIEEIFRANNDKCKGPGDAVPRSLYRYKIHLIAGGRLLSREKEVEVDVPEFDLMRVDEEAFSMQQLYLKSRYPEKKVRPKMASEGSITGAEKCPNTDGGSDCAESGSSSDSGTENVSSTDPSRSWKTWKCVELDSESHVTRLRLTKQDFHGSTILPEISRLSNLQQLRIKSKRVTGHIPKALCTHLPHLASFELLFSEVTGPIPPAISCLAPTLQTLRLVGNQLTGPIPTQLGALVRLTCLDLSENKLRANIPDALRNLRHLRELSLAHNNLTGRLPLWLHGLSQLEMVWLSKNDLTGPIPPTIYRATQLKQLLLDNNKLNGPLSPDVGSLHALTKLTLHDNLDLAGPIPKEVAELTNLGRLKIMNTGLEIQF